ncbi:MAG: 4Fe-4S ferredoxin [Desulfobacterales bacterium CG23_combo_of_CG06-09_8_20_14_all_51_8]|nr:MAG: 4Fe-4S ferredoxin [Desulfobacterales bacterium CG23_combo_of_CG06-09_8_20_14_all_51_8]
MTDYTDKIKEIAKRLLAEGKVDIVIGFRKGTLPMMNQPHVAASAESADELIWDSSCGLNLANYLTDKKGKIGIIAKGCDSRNIVTHVIENKIQRDQLYIIGVPCTGMIDHHKIKAMFDQEVRNVDESGDQITISGDGFSKTVSKQELLAENCAVCTHRNPVIYDELAGDLVTEQTNVDPYASVKTVEALSADEKWRYFEDLIAPCIRCYACRNACPLCYCPTCFVDESRPQWVGKSQDTVDIRTFHLLRAYHCAGRCTDCGACERACPMGIKIREFTKKLNKDCLELYGWEAGLSIDQRPPLDTYKNNDPQDFIK